MSLYEYDDYDDRRPLARMILCGAGVVVLSALLWFGVRPSLGGSGTTSASTFEPVASSGPVASTSAPVETSSSTVPTTTTTATTSATTAPPTTTAARPLADRVSAATTTTTTAATAPTTTAPSTASGASYPTMPDGSPMPVLAIYGTDTVTLTGSVPSQEAAERLAQLALANSKTPAVLVQLLSINPDVPETIGVRVVEMTSTRFPAGSAEILPDHGRELERMGAVMNALPHTTVLVIGHADQRGSEQANFALSEERARAVVNHLVRFGIDGARLSSRAVGESDLLSLSDDETALELNRRTEFVIYGVLVGA